MDYSSKFSPWLSLGCISARAIAKGIADYEATHGSNEGTYWLWFELLWRDYFRFLHFKYGRKLYSSSGLGNQKSHPFNQEKFEQWATGDTGEPFVDAGMRELRQSGFLSNRMRQIVASYWIYDMQGDWRAGAAWFESQLIDYDVYSNQGNWLYIAGKGTDPRGGRPFNVKKQAKDHDPDGIYQNIWLSVPKNH
jgi:deoxyribodipyrimidine photo-lyase